MLNLLKRFLSWCAYRRWKRGDVFVDLTKVNQSIFKQGDNNQ